MNLFYSSEINGSTLHFTLSEEESSHAIRVLRMRTGDKIIFTDGKGMFYEAEITAEHPKKCPVKIIRHFPDNNKRNVHLTIAIAPTKNIDRFEWFLEKATEIGCDEIVPLQCRHSERTVIKTERLNKLLVSAMKQCLKSEMPILHELTDLKTWIPTTEKFRGQKFIAHIPELKETEFPPKDPSGRSLHQVYKKGSSALITIGPEGGFSEEEVALAVKSGFTSIGLGKSRLRVETAGVSACAVINAINS